MSKQDFTRESYEAACAYRDAMRADGWSSEPIYPPDEDESRASKLRREGFVAQIITRDPLPSPPSWKVATNGYEGRVSIWGPDGMAITPPQPYSWDAVLAGVRTCSACGKADVDTKRYSFAGRCCAACLPAMQAEHEKPGWTN